MKFTKHDLADATQLIKSLATLNPDSDPHGSIDAQFTKACAEWSSKHETETPLTLEENPR